MDSAICFTQWNVGAVASGLRNLHTGLSDETMKPFQWGKEKDCRVSRQSFVSYQIPMFKTIAMTKNKTTQALVIFTSIPSIERPLFLPQ